MYGLKDSLMKLVTFSVNNRPRIGELVDDTVYTLAWEDTMRQMIRRNLVASRAYERFPLSAVKIHEPHTPSKILAIGLNYADHAKETGKEPPSAPLIFAKLPSAVIGTGEAITWRDSVTKEADYEAELGVVIGKKAKDVSEENAMDHVFGYTIANDVSARDVQLTYDSQWTRGKGLDTFCPLGPCIVTKDELPDPHALKISTHLNDELMQDGSTGDMIFKVPYLIAYLSRHFTLEPGDIILTGTPAGVGRAKTPPRYLQDGDTVKVTIEGIGELINPCRIIAE
jgi:2-keto-4-pentenoate hydratase/2-oxohepta-3-ene-1,7-dioic acid hydratase in catechol pathway